LGTYQVAGYSNGTWYTLTLRADGTALSVQVNGVTRITASDSAFSSGEAGVWSYASTAVSQHRFDDFVIQVLGGGHAPGGRLLAPEQGTGLFERLSNLIREVVNHVRNVPMKASLSAPPAGQTWKTYYSAGGQLVAMRVLTATGNTLYYLHSDHLGSTSLTTDSSGNVVARQNYYPYGQIRPGGAGTMPTDIGFTGQRAHDSSLGSLMFFQARYFSPSLGRFLSADTIVPEPGNPQAFNRYAYVSNNPVKYTDPTGHKECEEYCPGETYVSPKYTYNSSPVLTAAPTDLSKVTGGWGYGPNLFAQDNAEEYYSRLHGLHNGLDWEVPVGTPLYSMGYGIVKWTGRQGYLANADEQSIGIQYGKVIAMYGHTTGGGPVAGLAVGDEVTPGMLIGYSGHPVGEPDNAHLHLETRLAEDRTWTVNPMTYFATTLATTVQANWDNPNYPSGYNYMSMQAFAGGTGSFWTGHAPKSDIMMRAEYLWEVRHHVIDPGF
jgi:RHS repeat-associated protein